MEAANIPEPQLMPGGTHRVETGVDVQFARYARRKHPFAIRVRLGTRALAGA